MTSQLLSFQLVKFTGRSSFVLIIVSSFFSVFSVSFLLENSVLIKICVYLIKKAFFETFCAF